jgi:imidazolonepropionase-like amidohydrolase/Tol biopolymer transport system component
MRRSSLVALTLSVIVTTMPAFAVMAEDKKDDKKWDVNEPFGPTSKVTITTSEGTWMNLDVSPDGEHIVFDLLGDIFIIPINGGKATLLAGGPAFEVQPRFSPDGTRISFTSDRAGGDNIWVMDRDGSNMKQVTKEDFRLCNNACWTPDGDYIVAKKHFTSGRSLGAGEMWLYHVDGGGGYQLTKRKNDQQDVGEPWVSPDGRYVYFSEDMSGGTRFQYNKDPNGQIYMIRRVDREDGDIENVVRGPGGAVRPQLSRDGKLLAFVRRVRTKSVLHIQDLDTGELTPVFDGLYRDQQETWATFGVYPGYNWTPDDKHIVIWAKGKIVKVNVDTRAVEPVPFEVEANHVVHNALRYKQEVSPDNFTARMIRHGDTSPDGKWFVFSAVGHIWRKALPAGQPERITNEAEHWEYWPSFSADGKWIVYTTFSDSDYGSVYKIRPNGKGRKKLTVRPGYYLSPRFSSDGKRVVFRRVAGDNILGFNHGTEPGLYHMSADGGDVHFLRRDGEMPRFSNDGKRIYFLEDGSETKAYKSVDLAGGDERTLVTSKYANQFVPSPDEQWLAFTELYQGYIVPFPRTGLAVDVSGQTNSMPLQKVTRDAGTYLHWSGDSRKLHWTIGPQYFTRDLSETFMFVENAADSVAPIDTAGVDIGLVLDTDVPDGKLALVGARIITMKGDEVVENGTILVDRNRIVAVGDDVDVPSGYKTIDVTGKTIMPGIVDVHAHIWHSFTGISPSQSWPYLANLAFGVTTTHDPSNPTEMVFTHSEMVKAGLLVGPRVYSTGTILYGADGDFKAVVNSLDDARSHLRRMKAVGAFSVKSYNQPRRNQRQQVLKAASELEMMVVPEGGSFFFHNMSMIIDGHTGIEHTIPVAPIYNDVVSLWGQTETHNTPTLVVGYGGIWGENYWYQKTNVWESERLMNFTPRPLVDSRSRRRMMIADEEFNHIRLAENCKQLVDNGVHVHIGSHGQRQGIAAHWELWMFVQGGMTNMEALRCATIYGAYYVGLDDDIGSLEEGKLADLVVLNANPLDDIYNSEKIQYVMINGRIFDSMTMNEIGNHPHDRTAFYWERPGASDAFVWRGDVLGFEEAACSCMGGN